MDGLLFYFIAWVCWVVLTFFIRKTQVRYWLSFVLLGIILLANLTFTITTIQISYALVLILFSSVVILASQKKHVRSILSSLAITAGYTGALIFETVSPVWLILPRLLLLAFLSYLLMILITSSLWLRVGIWGVGLSAGECLYSLLLKDFGVKESIGELAYLDLYLVVVFMMVGIHYTLNFFHHLEHSITVRLKRKVGVRS